MSSGVSERASERMSACGVREAEAGSAEHMSERLKTLRVDFLVILPIIGILPNVREIHIL